LTIELLNSNINNDNENNNESNSITLRTITDRQKVVIETITMRLSTKEALVYLHEHGFPIKEATYYREKTKLENMKMERLNLMAKVGFVDQHLDKIDKLECIEKEMWKKYRECKDPYKGVEILTQIANLQPFLSAYYDSIRYVIKSRNRDFSNNSYDTNNKDMPTVF
jgi:hypothetical protein